MKPGAYATWSVFLCTLGSAFAGCAAARDAEGQVCIDSDAGGQEERWSDASEAPPDAPTEASGTVITLHSELLGEGEGDVWRLQSAGASREWLLDTGAIVRLLAGHRVRLPPSDSDGTAYELEAAVTLKRAGGMRGIRAGQVLKPIRFGDALLLRTFVLAPSTAFDVRAHSEVAVDPVLARADAMHWRLDVPEAVVLQSMERGRPITLTALDDAGRTIAAAQLAFVVALRATPRNTLARDEKVQPCRAWVRQCLDALPAGSIDTGACGSAPQVDRCGGLRRQPWARFPKSTFHMGCGSTEEQCSEGESPVHGVTLSPFELQRTEVSEDMMYACAAAGECELPLGIDPANRGAFPVVRVRPDEADDYCRFVGGRLPTEAEWERAARGDEGSTYPWGEGEPTCDRALWGACGNELSRVASLPKGATPSGLFDLAGSVFEWVADGYDAGFYGRSPSVDPVRAPDESTPYRVIRGGTFEIDDARLLRTTARSFEEPTYGFTFVGFRCARPLGPPELPRPITVGRFARDLRRHLVARYDARANDSAKPGGRTLAEAKRGVAAWLVQQVLAENEDPQGHDLAQHVVYRHPDTALPGSNTVWFGAYVRATGELQAIYTVE